MGERDVSKTIDRIFAFSDAMAKVSVVAAMVAACAAGLLAILGLIWISRHLVIAWN